MKKFILFLLSLFVLLFISFIVKINIDYNDRKNCALIIPSEVNYDAKGINLYDMGKKPLGSINVLTHILNFDYLWSEIRVKGGAYGCMSNFRKSGDSFLVSYRDPHLKNTLKIFENTPEYLHTFTADEREMTKYIIGTISDLDVPLNQYAKGELSLGAWFAGITEEELQEERNQILTAQPEDIQALGDLVEAVLKQRNICVVGSESALEKNREILKQIEPLVQ